MKWLSLDNIDLTNTLKQHCFVSAQCKEPILGRLYEGNISLCGSIRVINDNELFSKLSEFEYAESLNESKACKKCLLIYKRRMRNVNEFLYNSKNNPNEPKV